MEGVMRRCKAMAPIMEYRSACARWTRGVGVSVGSRGVVVRSHCGVWVCDSRAVLVLRPVVVGCRERGRS